MRYIRLCKTESAVEEASRGEEIHHMRGKATGVGEGKEANAAAREWKEANSFKSHPEAKSTSRLW